VAVVDGLFAGLDDVLGRREVGFTDGEIDDIDAVGFEFAGEIRDGDRRARFDTGDAVCE